MDEIQFSQIIVWVCFSLISIMSIRYYFATNSLRKIPNLEKKPSNQRILAIIPFRNEESIIEKTLLRVISETSSDKNSHLVLVNSASEDNTVEVVIKTIRESVLEDDSWTLMNLEKPGKGKALNLAMSIHNKDDIVVNIDADVQIQKGSFDYFRQLMSNEEMGAISAQESVNQNDPMAKYKTRSNALRIFESSEGNCPALEGSLLAWSPSRINWSSFDENSNADDAQIALSSIRSGHRSVVTSELLFQSVRDLRKGSFHRSIRRSQGLTQQLLKNADLLWNSRNSSLRSIMLFNILLHCIIPWCVIILLLAPPIILIEHPILASDYLYITSMAPSIIIILSLFSSSGRTLLRGSLASVFGQFRVLLRMRTNYWEPGEG